ncbi:hypothetical protein GF327_03270 [Candidatus Woesearchaeota archaeon]|nr:hypothetical protein [Candidatus Woesearchaeota archaeon]
MNSIIKKDILNLLKKSIDAIKKNEILKLRIISNEVIHNASIFQDEDSISAAVIIYTISKLYKETNKINELVLPYLKELVSALEKDNYKNYRQKLKDLLNDIKSNYVKTSFYLSEIFEQAHINKASKMYDHGISLSRVSETLGVSMWELLDYIGKTSISESYDDLTDVKNKIKYTRTLFSE